MKEQESGSWKQTHSYTGMKLREVHFGSGVNVSPFLSVRDLAVN
jgi:hypothetical protein